MVKFNALARTAIDGGKIELRVWRAGIRQGVVFVVERPRLGATTHLALSTEKFVDLGELARIAEETGLPVFAANGRVFPKGKTAADFVGL